MTMEDSDYGGHLVGVYPQFLPDISLIPSVMEKI
jgi:hypothetical protein